METVGGCTLNPRSGGGLAGTTVALALPGLAGAGLVVDRGGAAWGAEAGWVKAGIVGLGVCWAGAGAAVGGLFPTILSEPLGRGIAPPVVAAGRVWLRAAACFDRTVADRCVWSPA